MYIYKCICIIQYINSKNNLKVKNNILFKFYVKNVYITMYSIHTQNSLIIMSEYVVKINLIFLN